MLSPLLANAAMGLGLELFWTPAWFVFVAAIVPLEAWLIGRKLGLSWTKSLLISAGTNFATALAGFVLAPFFHTVYFGDPANPNPFLNAIALLAVAGLASAIVEGFVWFSLTPAELLNVRFGPWSRAGFAHLVSIPIALIILLVPSEPYPGLYAYVGHTRSMQRLKVAKAIMELASRETAMPDLKDEQALIKTLDAQGLLESGEDFSHAFEQPRFHRFSVRNTPVYEWNVKLSQKPIASLEESQRTWLVRRTVGPPYGLILRGGSYPRISTDTEELGYPPNYRWKQFR